MKPPLRSWAEIDLEAVRHNARIARRASGCGLIAIIKANAYGHGAVPVAEALAEEARMFGVATLSEALELRSAGIKKPILLLGCCIPAEREWVIKHRLVPCVSSLAEARAWDGLVKKKRGPALVVHAVLDTGMGRIGFPAKAWDVRTIAALARLKHLRIEGLASHFPSADEDPKFTRRQIACFGELQWLAFENGLQPLCGHLGNSAGVLGYPELRTVSNLVRPGLMLYGVAPQAEFQSLLRPALTWKTHVTLVRDLPKGVSISYGRTFKTRRPMRVATLAAGYADGFPRHLSGTDAAVLIRGQRCRLLGRVTMDQIMVDATEVKNAAPGGEVVLIGAQGRERITAAEVAAKAGTIPWEIFTRISGRVERVYG